MLPNGYSKNEIESKCRIIRDIYYRYNASNQDPSSKLLKLHAFRFSNDLCENDITPKNEMDKGCTKPVALGPLVKIPDDVTDAHSELVDKRKLEAILSSKAVTDSQVYFSEGIQIFSKHGTEKRGT